MSNKTLIFVFLILFMFQIAFVEAGFTFYSGSGVDDVCPRSTGLFTDVIENTGDTPLQFSVSSSGSASVFSTTVPTGFTLLPGKIKNIYTYVTPMSSIDTGNYILLLNANADGVSQEIRHDILVRDCYAYSFVSIESEKAVCPCESDKFTFEIKNEGEYSEAYFLEVEGSYASSVVLSQNTLSLSPGESKEIFAYVKSDCDDQGSHEFSVVVKPSKGKSIKSQTVDFIVDTCYNFGVSTSTDLINMCDHMKETISVTIDNKGTTSNVYELKVDGPLWAVLSNNKVEVAPGESKTVNLEFVPDYGVEGSYQVTFNAIPEKGTVKAVNTFNVNVKKCHDVSVTIEKDSDKICNSLDNNYAVIVRNQGEFSKEFFVSVEGPSWAALDSGSVTLSAGEEKQLTLTVSPSYDVPAGDYTIKVNVAAKDSDKIASSDSLIVETVTKKVCYGASLKIDDSSVSVYYDSSATVPVVVENKGADRAGYTLDVTGTASNFVYLNPSVIEVDPGQSEIVYLYIAPSTRISNGDYSATISVRLSDSTVMASESVKVTVTDSSAEKPADVLGEFERRESLFSQIVQFFSDLFSRDSVENGTVVEEEAEEEPEEVEVLGSLVGVGESLDFKIGDEEHTMKVSDTTDTTILLEISSDPVFVQMDVGDTKEVDVDGDGVNDIEVFFNGFVDGKSDLSYNVLEQETAPEETTGGETGGSFFDGFVDSLGIIFSGLISGIVAYQTQLIVLVVLIIVIIILAKTNVWKNIVKFFEEEIEEENLVAAGKPKEKPVKEEPVKKEEKKPKEEKKKVEEEEDEFVIEFDDDE